MGVKKRMPVVVNPLRMAEGELRVKLAENWRFRLDPENVGVGQKWYASRYSILREIRVPGCWQGQGFGTSEKETHKEFGLDIRAFQATYEGTGWYQTVFTVPDAFVGKRLWLNFGGVNPTAEIWLNGEKLGENHEPFTPFAFEVTDRVCVGENVLTVRVSEEDRELGMTYHYCGRWSGLYRDVELSATGASYLDQVSVLADVDTRTIRVKAEIGDAASEDLLWADVYAPESGEHWCTSAQIRAGRGELLLQLPEIRCWSPETPALYQVQVQLCRMDAVQDAQWHRVGFVKLEGKNKQFLINGQPYYLRGCGDFGEMPETGSPNTDRDHWRRCLQTLRDYGYQQVRCQTFVPVPEYFDAADEVGLLVQSEMGMTGPICGHSYFHTYNQWPKPTPDYRERYRAQWNHVVQRDVNHPSANIYCMSNEIGCTNMTVFPKMSWRCYEETRAIKPTAMVIWTDGGFREDLPGEFVNDDASSVDKTDKPVIQHEYQWWSSFPDVTLIPKYEGLATRPFAEEIAMEAASAHGISHILPQAAKNSQKLQALEAKCKLESLRRNYPRLAGVSHFNAVDTGLSKQGIVDMFYEKKCVDAETWRMTNDDTVVLCSLNFNDRNHAAGEIFSCKLYVSDFSHPQFEAPELRWRITAEDRVFGEGTIAPTHQPFITYEAGVISMEIPSLDKPVSAVLSAELTDGARVVRNQWRLWFYPAVEALPEGAGSEPAENVRTVVTSRLTPELVEFVRGGGNVILKAGEGMVRPFIPFLQISDGSYFYTRPANFPPFEELQDGTIIQPHPMLGDFPCEDYADMQFFNMIGESPALDLEPLELTEDDPVIRMIHSYYVCRPLGYLTERGLGRGRVIITALNVDSGRPEANYLLRQLCLYAMSGDKPACVPFTESSLEKVLAGSSWT